MSSATGKLADNLSSAILNQDDPDIVKDGAPAYLLLIDGLIEGDPENENLLLTGAKLNGAYASVFVTDPQRAKILSGKALDYGLRGLCGRNIKLCNAPKLGLDLFLAALGELDEKDLPALYTSASVWAGWIQANSDDWNAIAQLPRVEAMMSRCLELDEQFQNGAAHLYLGVIYTLLPPAMGGKPEKGRQHFERAIELSEDRDLLAKVFFAEKYARLVFDRELHDRLLEEVLQADPKQPGLMLTNSMAQKKARQLLDSAAEYF